MWNSKKKNKGYVYSANFENDSKSYFKIIAPYKDLAAELLQRVNDGAFSENTTYSGKMSSTIVTYDLGCSYPNEEDDSDDDDSDQEDDSDAQ